MKFLLISVVFFHQSAFALNCAISEEFPPYQFLKDEIPVGLDVDLVNLYNKFASEKVNLFPMKGVDVMGNLYFTADIDCVIGVGITKAREANFLFIRDIYRRTFALFAKKTAGKTDSKDFKSKILAGDEYAEAKKLLKSEPGLKHARIRKTINKRESMDLLKQGKVAGVILPYDSGLHLGKQMRMDLRVVAKRDKGSPVGIAFKRTSFKAFESMKNNFKKIPEKDFKATLKKWKLNGQ